MQITKCAKPMNGFPYCLHEGGCSVVSRRAGPDGGGEIITRTKEPVLIAYSWQVDVILKHREAMIVSLASFCDDVRFHDSFEMGLDFIRRAISRYQIDADSTLTVDLEGFINPTIYQKITDERGNAFLRKLIDDREYRRGVFVDHHEVESYFSIPADKRVGVRSPSRINSQYGPVPLLSARTVEETPTAEELGVRSWKTFLRMVPYPVSRNAPFPMKDHNIAIKDNVVPFVSRCASPPGRANS